MNNFTQLVSRKEVLLFLAFYVASAFIYYTATWVTWGGLAAESYPYFALEEFFAAAGVDFVISFFVTIPIWYITVVLLRKRHHYYKLVTHIFFLPLYLLLCYSIQSEVKSIFGWAMFWGGSKAVWTFYNLMLFYVVQFSLIHAYNYFKRFKKEQQEKFELREIALKSEMTALKAQLNPHFLHNLFNSINATLLPENEQTRALIVQLSDLFRYQNYAAQQELVTLREEVDFIENYLQLMKVRLKNRLNYQFEVPAELNGFKIAPMLLHPLVENAVTHGIAPQIAPSFLLVKVVKVVDKVVFSIEDTGVGITDKNVALAKGIGLPTTKMRLQKLYNAELKVEDNSPQGTKISFAL